jgi:hypothetical protein
VPKPSEWLDPVVAVVERFTTRWALAGALAADEYRLTPRLTTDLDIYTEWRSELVAALEDNGYAIRQIVDPSVGHPHLLLCTRADERVDILIPTVDYQDLALDRAQDRHVLTVEDVIVHKLIAWRDKDKDDIASILAAGHDLDREYIERWSDEWEVTDRWRDATRAR